MVIFFYFIPLLKEYSLLGQLKMNLGFKEEDVGKQKELLAVFSPSPGKAIYYENNDRTVNSVTLFQRVTLLDLY